MDLRYRIIGILFACLVSIAKADEEFNAQNYLQQALTIIQQNALHAEKVNWPQVTQQAFKMTEGASTPAAIYPVIRYVLEQLNDRHSWLKEPVERAVTSNSHQVKEAKRPSGRLIANHVAYIVVPGFGGTNREAQEYAQRLSGLVLRLQRKNPVGWVIDLRQNTGGSMWPMLAGLSTLFDQEILGGIDFNNGQTLQWGVRAGESFLGNETQLKAILPKAESPLKNKPFIAILMGPDTASSGEAIIISFKNQPNTKFFGEPTYGVSTNNSAYPLPDGAILYLTNGVFFDRTGQRNGGKIEPDIKVSAAIIPKSDLALDAALAWMLEELDVVVAQSEKGKEETDGKP
jgi:carboxyl-terminal processing protease